jgi:hypothetical protein
MSWRTARTVAEAALDVARRDATRLMDFTETYG